MPDIAYFSAISLSQKVDPEAGIIFGVSVITEGQAQGINSGVWIDRTTLSQIHAIGTKSADGIKVKLSQMHEHDGSAGQIVGSLKSFRFDSLHLRADLHLLKSDPNFAKIIEMAQKTPSHFGLSIVSPKAGHSLEEIDGKKFLRCSEISSTDLVEAPAANKGLFFSQQPTNDLTMSIKYAKGESGDHAKDCDCKECMSKHGKKEMTAMFATMLGLNPETATETEIATAFKASRGASVDIAPLTTKITELTGKLTALETGNANALALSKKAEIDALVTEASRDGKVIPLDTDDLYTVKDGIVTIKTEPTQLSKMIAKLPKSTIRMTRQLPVPKTTDGKDITNRRSPEFMAFAREQRKQGAIELGNMILSQNNGLTRN